MKLYIGNLSYQTRESDLEALFGAHGEVTSTQVIMDRQSGRSRGFGFAEMANDDEGRAAVEACNGMSFMGRNITVNEARPQEERPRRDFSKPRSDYRSGGGNRY